MKNVLISLLLILPHFLLGQFAPSLKMISEAIESHSDYEKIYLHTDRAYYTGGGDIFFKVYLTNQNLSQRKTKSKIAYVDLIGPDQTIITTKTIAIKGGQGLGDFKITSKYKGGNYVLRAYTQYMKNFDTDFFFRKAIYIHGVNNLAEVSNTRKLATAIQFFPEGGDLVQGLTSKVAIKATNTFGEGMNLTGKLINEKGAIIADVTTNENGFGEFSLKPEVGKDYTFEGLYDGEKFKETLPAALSEGIVIKVDNTAEDNIQLQISTNNPTILDGGYLIGQGMGQVFFEEELTPQARINFEIAITEIPSGILQFTLFDKLRQPRAERLVFNHDGINNFNVDITANQTTYGKREKVQVQLDIYDDEGETIAADLSLSVVDKSLEVANFNKDNIQSYLLLSGDIKGVIKNPMAYFKDTKLATKQALDLLLMTQGWRRFSWQNALKEPTKEMVYAPEQSLSRTGKITKKNKDNEPVKAVGYLSELSASLAFVPFETDEMGEFLIDNLEVMNGTDMVLQAATLNKKQQKVKKGSLALKGDRAINIELVNKLPVPINKKDRHIHFLANSKKTTVHGLSNLENIQYKNDVAYNEIDEWSIELDSISVTAKKIDKVVEYYEDGMLYKRPDTRIRMDEVIAPNAHNNIFAILQRAPGLKIDNGGVIIRGRQTGLSKNVTISNNAKFMVNGALVSDEYATSINPANIAFIDVVRSLNKLSVFGEVGSNGLVMIYLKSPQDQEKKEKEIEGIKNFSFKGYDAAREFYIPTYNITNRENGKADNRVTLHWEPTIQFNESGEAYIEFYTSDRTGVYDIIVEGISKTRLPVVAHSKIIVK